jgi:phosphoribosylformylglycinamidine (FGAM) synthase-like amidotransferase family enzyme
MNESGIKNCMNCVHMAWYVGIGQGVRCLKKENLVKDSTMLITNKRFVCQYHELDLTVSEDVFALLMGVGSSHPQVDKST